MNLRSTTALRSTNPPAGRRATSGETDAWSSRIPDNMAARDGAVETGAAVPHEAAPDKPSEEICGSTSGLPLFMSRLTNRGLLMGLTSQKNAFGNSSTNICCRGLMGTREKSRFALRISRLIVTWNWPAPDTSIAGSSRTVGTAAQCVNALLCSKVVRPENRGGALGWTMPAAPLGKTQMKTIDLNKAAAYRQEWERMAVLWDREAESRTEKARTDAAKYRMTHLGAAKDARAQARHYRNLIDELDKQVDLHKQAGKAVQ